MIWLIDGHGRSFIRVGNRVLPRGSLRYRIFKISQFPFLLLIYRLAKSYRQLLRKKGMGG